MDKLKNSFIALAGLVALIGTSFVTPVTTQGRSGGITNALMYTIAGQASSQSQQPREKVLIHTPKPYQSVVESIQAAGGTVTHQYKYVDAIAAEVTREALRGVRSFLRVGAVTKDVPVPAPTDFDAMRGRPELATTGDETRITSEFGQQLGAPEIAAIAAARPSTYLINNSIMNVSPLHVAGINGAGVIVAVIDSGIRPMFPHIAGSVIGGEDFVGDGLGFSNDANDGHGTFVSGMIASHLTATFSAGSPLQQAILAECPSCFTNPPTNTQIQMIGTAPAASIYALRVFGLPGDSGSVLSRIIAAMERVIELREKFDNGQPGGLNIRVCNMSLTGVTLSAGRGLLDNIANVMLEKDIVPVIVAGNNGPSSLTVGSPGTASGAVTVGAASQAHNHRIQNRILYGPTIGSLVRPSLGPQTAFFSARGPNADGRADPDVIANGLGNLGQGYFDSPNSVSFGWGTSFAAPSVAGVVALVRQQFPAATARKIRNAILMSANPNLLTDGSTEFDQGRGYVDALAASNLLAGGSVPDTLEAPGSPNKSVKVNVEQGTALRVRAGTVQQHFSNLKPGQRHEIIYHVTPNTSQVTLCLRNVTPSLPLAEQNRIFGDNVLLTVHSAKTSAIFLNGYVVYTFTSGGTFPVNNPETGLLRVTVSGSYTNAGTISGDVSIHSVADPLPGFTEKGEIADGQLLTFRVDIPAGVSVADFRLGFREDWSNYPASDVDMYLIRPDGSFDFSGATFDDPERVSVSGPMAGTWHVLVDGFEIPTGTDKFELRVTLDGHVVR
jgi:subtilisin family serine protease